MPLIVKDKLLEKNNWILSDLITARSMINAILGDLESNDKSHVDYVLEKLGRAEDILSNINDLCRRANKVEGGESNE